jgi:hypothetical protein
MQFDTVDRRHSKARVKGHSCSSAVGGVIGGMLSCQCDCHITSLDRV